MTQTAVVVAPGRGTYNRDELGYFARHHADKSSLLHSFDQQRAAQGQPSLAELDGAARYSGAVHARGDNASALIYACAFADFQSINHAAFDILAVTGNSMGWYTALACAGALSPQDGHKVANTMGTLMQDHMIGAQVIYPFVDENWQVIPGARRQIERKMTEINTRKNHFLALSIDLGGMLVLAGNSAGVSAFEAEMQVVQLAQSRFPMRLPGHAGFHTALQAPVSQAGFSQLGPQMFSPANLPMIDGRGAIWHPKADLGALRAYTLGHQVVEPYDFAAAIRVAAREFMPDVFIVLGPGNTLGGAVAQSLLSANWRDLSSKADFQACQAQSPRVIAMGRSDQRALAV